MRSTDYIVSVLIQCGGWTLCHGRVCIYIYKYTWIKQYCSLRQVCKKVVVRDGTKSWFSNIWWYLNLYRYCRHQSKNKIYIGISYAQFKTQWNHSTYIFTLGQSNTKWDKYTWLINYVVDVDIEVHSLIEHNDEALWFVWYVSTHDDE